jgi:hypothetical protein
LRSADKFCQPLDPISAPIHAPQDPRTPRTGRIPGHARHRFAFGATAIYAGQPRYSLRVRNNDFGDLPVLADGINRARALGKHFYVVANIYPHGAKIKTFIKDIAPVIALKPDALIMSDPGLILMVRENFPEMPIHLGTGQHGEMQRCVLKSAGISV